jgi:hypothetical protein
MRIAPESAFRRLLNSGSALSGMPTNRSKSQDWAWSNLETRIGLLTGQSLPKFRCDRKRRFNADRHVLREQ